MSEPAKPNRLSADWAREQFGILSPQTQIDVRTVLKVLREKNSIAATKKIRALGVKREWPHWVLLALRDIIGTAHSHKLEL